MIRREIISDLGQKEPVSSKIRTRVVTRAQSRTSYKRQLSDMLWSVELSHAAYRSHWQGNMLISNRVLAPPTRVLYCYCSCLWLTRNLPILLEITGRRTWRRVLFSFVRVYIPCSVKAALKLDTVGYLLCELDLICLRDCSPISEDFAWTLMFFQMMFVNK